jgi:hypothetical protein
MISLVASPEQIIIDNIVYVTLTIDDEINQKAYQGIFINLLVKKVGTNNVIPTYRFRYNGEPLVWEINKYTYGDVGTFQVTANVYDGPQIANTTFVVKDSWKPQDSNIGSGITSKVQLLNNANANSRAQNFPKFVEVNPNAQRVQQTGIDYLKPSNVVPVSTFTQENPSINYGKVQGKGKNVNPS